MDSLPAKQLTLIHIYFHAPPLIHGNITNSCLTPLSFTNHSLFTIYSYMHFTINMCLDYIQNLSAKNIYHWHLPERSLLIILSYTCFKLIKLKYHLLFFSNLLQYKNLINRSFSSSKCLFFTEQFLSHSKHSYNQNTGIFPTTLRKVNSLVVPTASFIAFTFIFFSSPATLRNYTHPPQTLCSKFDHSTMTYAMNSG